MVLCTYNMVILRLVNVCIFSDRDHCTPVQHIYYLKVHKTGSTTMGSILLRIAANNNLYIAQFSNAVSNFVLSFIIIKRAGSVLYKCRSILIGK